MDEIKERLLPPKVPKPASAMNLRESATYRSTAFGRQPFQGVDLLGMKKRGHGLRSWIRVDTSGNSQIIEVDKFTMMRRCDLPARDLRLLDPLFVYPSTILGREKAIVVNLEQIRCIITADEVLLLNSLDNYVLRYVVELQRRLTTSGAGDVWQSDGSDMSRRRGSRGFDNVFASTSPDYLPFEFRALEVALEAACTFLDSQAAELEIEAYPLLDELTSKISTLNLERARRLKSRLLALTRRVQKVRDEVEQLMDDDGDMAEMYLTEKKSRMETSFHGDQSVMGYRSNDGVSISAPVSPVSSPPDGHKLEKSLSIARSRNESMRSSESATESIEELEMLLEAYFVVIDSTLNKLTSLKEYIDDTEDFINIQLMDQDTLLYSELLRSNAIYNLSGADDFSAPHEDEVDGTDGDEMDNDDSDDSDPSTDNEEEYIPTAPWFTTEEITYNPGSCSNVNPVGDDLFQGQCFGDKQIAIDAVKASHIRNSRNYHVTKSDTTRYEEKCVVAECPWRIRVMKSR